MSLLKNKFDDFNVPLKKIDENSSILFIGNLFSVDNKIGIQKIIEKSKDILCCSAIEDFLLYQKNIPLIKYEVGSEAGVLSLIAKELFGDYKVSQKVTNYLEELDDGYLSAESNVGEEEIIKIVNFIKNSSSCTIVFGADLLYHPDSQAIAQLSSILQNYKTLHVSFITNEINNKIKKDDFCPEIKELNSFDGTIVYLSPTSNCDDLDKIFGSRQFQIAAKIKENDKVTIKTEYGEYNRIFVLDTNMKGTISILPLSNEIKTYRFQKAIISLK